MMRLALYATLFTAPLLVASQDCSKFDDECPNCVSPSTKSAGCATFLNTFDGNHMSGIFKDGDGEDCESTAMHNCYGDGTTKTDNEFNDWKTDTGCTKSIGLCTEDDTCESKYEEFKVELADKAAFQQVEVYHQTCKTCAVAIAEMEASVTKSTCDDAEDKCKTFTDFTKNPKCCDKQDCTSSEDTGEGDSGEVVDKCTTNEVWSFCNGDTCAVYRECLGEMNCELDPSDCSNTCQTLINLGCKNALLANANDNSGAENVAAGFAAAITAVVALFIA
jgi:hypothetical protein